MFRRLSSRLLFALLVLVPAPLRAQVITQQSPYNFAIQNSLTINSGATMPSQFASFDAISQNYINVLNYAPAGTGSIGLEVSFADSTVRANYSQWAIAGANMWTGSSLAATKTQVGVAGEASTTGTATILSLYGFDASAIMYTGAASISIGIGYHSQLANHSANPYSAAYDVYAQEVVNDGGGSFTTHYGHFCEAFSIAGTNWCIYATAPTKSFFGGDIKFGQALVTTTNNITPTFLTNAVGGAGGPVTGVQNGWKTFVDSTGATFWVPVWK